MRHRALVHADAGAVLTLQRAAYVSEAQLYGDAFLPALTQTLNELEIELKVSAGWGIWSDDGRMLAAVRWRVQDGVARIGRLVVAPDLQGQGLGTQLLSIATHQSGARRFELFTGDRSEGNIRLYERLGFVETRREEMGPGLTYVYLEKSAPPPPPPIAE